MRWLTVLSPALVWFSVVGIAGIGKVGVMLGAGRQRIEDGVDFAAGVKISRKVGEAVEVGEPLCWIYTNKDDSALTKLAIERAGAATPILRDTTPGILRLVATLQNTNFVVFDVFWINGDVYIMDNRSAWGRK